MSDDPTIPRFTRRVPDGDEHERLICDSCGFVSYENPRIIVGSVAELDDRVLLCRRAIEPRRGYWTLPAGFMEMAETASAGACREAWEEARAKIEHDALLAVYSLTHISQVQIFYRGRLLSADVEPGPESLEVGLFAWDEIPRGDLAFPTVAWALDYWRQTRGRTGFQPDLRSR